jgi:endo-1,3(4)-beta-glucanase
MPNHPAKAINLNGESPIHTNRFYTNLFVGDQLSPIFTHPYSLQFTNCSQPGATCGMSVSHVARTQTVFGPGNPARYYLNPVGIRSIVFSSSDLGQNPVMFTNDPKQFSINAFIASAVGNAALIGFPVVQGMGFVTSQWYGTTTPLIRSDVFFRSLVSVGKSNSFGTFKYRMVLSDGNTWLLYLSPSTAGQSTVMVLRNSSTIQGSPNFHGIIQVAKLPQDPVGAATAERNYDKSAGTYPTKGTLSGSIMRTTGSYSISWAKGGFYTQTLMMYLLPHHVQSLSTNSSVFLTSTQLDTTTKGKATAFLADQVTFTETSMTNSVLFDPYPPNSEHTGISASTRRSILAAATIEIGENFTAQASGNSMYWNGKVRIAEMSLA